MGSAGAVAGGRHAVGPHSTVRLGLSDCCSVDDSARAAYRACGRTCGGRSGTAYTPSIRRVRRGEGHLVGPSAR